MYMYVCKYISNDRNRNNELERMWKASVKAKFKVLLQNLRGGSEKTHKTCSSWPRFKPGTRGYEALNHKILPINYKYITQNCEDYLTVYSILGLQHDPGLHIMEVNILFLVCSQILLQRYLFHCNGTVELKQITLLYAVRPSHFH